MSSDTLTVTKAKRLLKKGSPIFVEDEYGVKGRLINAVGHVTAIVDWPDFKGHELSIHKLKIVRF